MRHGVSLSAAVAAVLSIAAAALAWEPTGGATSAAAPLGRSAAVPPPSNQVAPEVSGTLRDGEIVVALPGLWNGDMPMRFSNRWERCDERRCTATPGRVGFLTRLIAADVGRRMRTVVTASNDGGTVRASSPQTGIVRPKLQRMDPFPVVALRGFVTRRGIYITRLSARGPVGAALRVTCRGRGCPYRRAHARFRRGFVVVRRMHRRTLAFDSVLSLRITQGANRIGKYTRFRMRPRRRPARVDQCLVPGDPSPSRCRPRE